MSVRSPTAGTWSSSQWRPDNEFETDRSRSGYYSRPLVTRVGTLELRIPQDRDGRLSTEVFARYERSEKALVCTLADIYVQGVSTRKVKAVTEQLCGQSVSASTVSRVREERAGQLGQFAERPLAAASPYLVLDARDERVREAGVIRSRAVLIAVGIIEEGHRCVLGVDLANRESTSSWRAFLEGNLPAATHELKRSAGRDLAVQFRAVFDQYLLDNGT